MGRRGGLGSSTGPNKLTEATGHIDTVGVRQRTITRKLRDVQTMPEGEAVALLGIVDVADADKLATDAVAQAMSRQLATTLSRARSILDLFVQGSPTSMRMWISTFLTNLGSL